ncbi:MAG TPA: hypothetical protein VGN96_00250 [Roseococcus sp.]|jgi:hypothetical protein|nr:hypothetical protein [Roseococcus sp.]
MEETPAELWALIGKCALSSTLGCAAWLSYPATTNPYEVLIFALGVGFGGTWLVTKAIRLLRRLTGARVDHG